MQPGSTPVSRHSSAGDGHLRIAIVGGGYAGMAAAAELARSGIAVTVFEAGKVLGGRARRVEIDGITLDNGLHVLIGAYSETLRLIDLTTAPGESRGLIRLPLELTLYPDFAMRVPKLPAPLHLAAALLAARGLTLGDKLRAARFMLAMRRQRFRLPADMTVSELLTACRQSERVSRLLWGPLCVSALNTRPEQASARVFLAVLRDSLSGKPADSDLLLPALDFSALFPERAARYVDARSGEVRLGSTVEAVRRTPQNFEIEPDGGQFDRVILAVSPHRIGMLIAPHAQLAPLRNMIESFSYQPIYSVYLQYPAGTRLPFRMGGIDAAYSQWVFDRGQLCGQDGLIGVVISASGAHQELPQSELARKVHAELAAVVPGLQAPQWQRVIAEKRATFACTPGLVRPDNGTALPGLFLAGDYTVSDYPATLEAAVRSGVRAAHLAMKK
ncbi:MAG TPA: hydroxysqualene dehydroxylase HpnE [Burkholderiales bacterium]